MIDPNEKNVLREQTQRKIAELALMFAVPILTNAVGNSRLDGLQRRLQKVTEKKLRYLRSMNESVLQVVADKLKEWGDNSGWVGNPKEHTALISFCLVIIDESPINHGSEITKILNLISDHLDDADKLMTKAMVGGQEAAENWAEMYEV